MESHQTKNDLYIFSEKFGMCIRIKPNGYIPRSGFLLINALEKESFINKNVIDMGCGETGIIAHYLHSRSAQHVIGVDIDSDAISHVRTSSDQSSEIEWIVSDLFEKINEKFDFLISNPPQMPTSPENRFRLKDFHDSPGDSGRETIIRILKEAKKFIKTGGHIFMIIFDFLGIKKSFNLEPSLEEIANINGFNCEIVSNNKQVIRIGGQTEKNIPWIKKVYPGYSFTADEQGNLYHNVVVVKFSLL